jgi:hypothetical protein
VPAIFRTRKLARMPTARKDIYDPHTAGSFHCVARCVRRSWLCGVDAYTKLSFEHRKHWIVERIKFVADIFACGVLSYAVMSNHFHLVVSMLPSAAHDWDADEVARRWLMLYPSAKEANHRLRLAAIAGNPDLIKVLRARLCNLSWLMKSISEPIARRANAEDEVKGRFWEGRFKCQALLDDKSILAAMNYVDLNPVRAKTADDLEASDHSSIQARFKAIRKDPKLASAPLQPLMGVRCHNLPEIRQGDYLALVDFTGRQLAPGKRGKIDAKEPTALKHLGLTKFSWNAKVKGVGKKVQTPNPPQTSPSPISDSS